MRSLSNAEYVCLVLASVGNSRTQIAEQLGVKPGTVAQHWNRVNLKLQTGTIQEAIEKAYSLGLIEKENPSQVSRVVRRSMGLPSKKNPKMRFASIREAIQIEADKRKR